MSTESMPIPVKKSPRSNHKFATYVVQIADCMKACATYANANPSAAMLQSLADGLVLANAKAKHGGPATRADRDAKRLDLEHLLDVLVMFVRETVRVQAPSPADAATMILNAGLSIKKTGKAPKDPFAAKHGDVSGKVVLVARAVARTAMYYWEISLDQQSWTSVPETLKARATITGLTPGQRYYFRFRAHTRKGLGDYSDVVTLIVI